MQSRKIALILLVMYAPASFAVGGFGQDGNVAIFSSKATKYIMNREYAKLGINTSIFFAGTLLSGIGLRMALDLYKSTKDNVHRKIWGPTQEDKIIAMELEKNKNLTLEKQQALRIGNIKLEQANLDFYTSIMDKIVARAKTSEEKDRLSKVTDETLAQLAEIAKKRIIAGHSPAIA